MIEIFITDIQNKAQSDIILSALKNNTSDLKFCFDFNETEFPFPCGHTILRVEGKEIDADKICTTLKKCGFQCKILEDKICVGVKNAPSFL